MVNAFAANPVAGQNVHFYNGVNVTDGEIAQTPGGTPGVTFLAKVQNDSIAGSPDFVQNVTSLANGMHGAPAGAPVAGGWYDTNLASIYDMVPGPDHSLPILDNAPGKQTYDWNFHPSVAGDVVTITDQDMPAAAALPNDVSGYQLDYQPGFRLYLVWTWPQMGTTVLYTLGYTNWQAALYATQTTINVPHGVTADSSWVHSNADAAELRLANSSSVGVAIQWVFNAP